MKITALLPLAAALALSNAAHAGGAAASSPPATVKPTAAEAKAFVAKVNDDLKRLYAEAARADWIKNTYITDDTEALSAQAAEKLMLFQSAVIKEAARFDGVAALDADTARALLLLKISPDLIDQIGRAHV